MNILKSQPQSQQRRNKVKSVLVRYCGNKEVREDRLGDKNYQHPENAYLVKYFPKHYKNLTLIMKPQNSLSSRVKRIKKLKRFSGKFNDKIPQVNWFKILANNRKEIEELPQIVLSQAQRLFWAKTSLHAVRFFSQTIKLQLPTYKSKKFTPKNFLAIWEALSKHLKNMRRLKILEILVNEDSGILKQLFKKLNGMPRLIGNLDVLKSRHRSDSSRDILENKNIFSSLTNLNYASTTLKTFLISQVIPQICKELKSFSLKFDISSLKDFNGDPEFLGFIPPIQELPKLQSINIDWTNSWPHEFWSYLRPPASLRRLKLQFKAQDMIEMVFKAGSLSNYENLFDNWKEIKELDSLEIQIRCENGEEILFTRNFTTSLLKKVSRLTSFQCRIDLRYKGIWRYEPFLIEKVPHLYEHLRKFKVNFIIRKGPISFDFGFLKPFKNLKDIDFEGYSCSLVNITDAVRLLEENMRDGEFSTLQLGQMEIHYKEDLMKLLKKISKEKKSKTHFKMVLALVFKMQAGDDEITYLDQFCEIIESNSVKGLEISLDIRQDNESCNIDEVKRVLDKYPGLRNFVLQIYYYEDILEFIKRDGEKTQLLYYPDDV